MDTNLEKLVQQYADELEWIELESQSLTLEKHIDDIINIRDKIHKYLKQNTKDLKVRKKLRIQDKKLKYLRNHQPLQQAFQKYYQEHSLYDLREYWWHYQSWSQNRCLQSIMARDHLWSFIAIICLSFTLILIIDLFLKFFDVTSGFFQTLAIAFPTLITIFVGEGLLTQAGQGWFDDFLKKLSRKFYCFKHNLGFWRFISALIVLIITVFIGLSFPRIAHNFYWYTGTIQCGKDCENITKKLTQSTPGIGEGKTPEPKLDNHWMSTIKFMEKIKILGLFNLDIKTDKIDLDAAIRNLNYALKIDPNDDYFPDNNAIHYYLGKVYQQVRDFENAHFNYKLAYRGSYDEALNDIAESYLDQGNYSKAADVLYKATESERVKTELKSKDYSLTLQQINIANKLINRYIFDEKLQSYSEAFKWIRVIENYLIPARIDNKNNAFNIEQVIECIFYPEKYQTNNTTRNQNNQCYNYKTKIQKIWLSIKQNRITKDANFITMIEEVIELNNQMHNHNTKKTNLNSSFSTPIKNPQPYCLRAQAFDFLLSDINNQINTLENEKDKILIEQGVSNYEEITNEILRKKAIKIEQQLESRKKEKDKNWHNLVAKLKKSSDPPPNIVAGQCTTKPEVIVYQLWKQCNDNINLPERNAHEKDWRSMFNTYRANLLQKHKNCVNQLIQKQKINTVNQEESLNVHQS